MPENTSAMKALFQWKGIGVDDINDQHLLVNPKGFDWEASADLDIPTLVSATFGYLDIAIDVTAILRYLLMKQGNTRLSLERPNNGPQYWYICIFGDPAPRQTKNLMLYIRDSKTDQHSTKMYSKIEDSRIDIPLRMDKEVNC